MLDSNCKPSCPVMATAAYATRSPPLPFFPPIRQPHILPPLSPLTDVPVGRPLLVCIVEVPPGPLQAGQRRQCTHTPQSAHLQKPPFYQQKLTCRHGSVYAAHLLLPVPQAPAAHNVPASWVASARGWAARCRQRRRLPPLARCCPPTQCSRCGGAAPPTVAPLRRRTEGDTRCMETHSEGPGQRTTQASSSAHRLLDLRAPCSHTPTPHPAQPWFQHSLSAPLSSPSSGTSSTNSSRRRRGRSGGGEVAVSPSSSTSAAS